MEFHALTNGWIELEGKLSFSDPYPLPKYPTPFLRQGINTLVTSKLRNETVVTMASVTS